MDIGDLDALLVISDGTFTLGATTIPDSNIGPLLQEFNGGRALTIAGAVKQPLERSDTQVTITGTLSLLGLPSLAVTATFSIDTGGNPVVSLRMPLPTGAGGWSFRRIFPSMPPFKAGRDDGSSDPGSDLLDSIALTDAALVLTNQAGTDPDLPAPLVSGLNVIGHADPSALLGPLETVLRSVAPPVVTGRIDLPMAGQAVPALVPGEFAWNQERPVPGIKLAIGLGSTPALPGTSIALDEVSVRLYAPADAAWAAANPTYAPQVALTAALTVGSEIGPVELTALTGAGYANVLFLGRFDGFSIANLAALAGLSGQVDLFGALPSQLQQTGAELSLVAAGLQLATHADRTGGPAITAVYLTVGMPALTLDLGVCELTSLLVEFAIATPFSSPTLDVQVHGEGTIASLGHATFDVTFDATTGDSVGILSDASLPITAVFDDLGLSPPSGLSDLTIDSAELEVTSSGIAFDMTATDQPAWSFPLGPVNLIVSNFVLQASRVNGQSAMSIGGQIAVTDDIVLTMGFDLPGDFLILASFADTTLSALIGAVGLPFSVPNGFDLTFEDTWAMITEHGGTFAFTAATRIQDVGLLELSVTEAEAGWGFAAGIDLDVSTLATLPGLGPLAVFEQFVGLTNLMIVASTLDDASFAFPELSTLEAPDLGGQQVQLPKQATGVNPGFTAYGSLSTTQSRGLQALSTWLGVPVDGTIGVTLYISAPDPETNSRLFFSVDKTVDEVAIVGELGATLQSGAAALFLAGTATATVQGQPMVFTISAYLAEDGVYLNGGYTGTIRFTYPSGPHPVQLSNLGLVLGIDFDGIPTIGISATIDVGSIDASAAVLFDSVNPRQSMVAGAVSDVTLADVVSALAGPAAVPSALAGVLARIDVRGLEAFSLQGEAATSAASALDARNLSGVATALQPNLTLTPAIESLLVVVNLPGQQWHLTDMTTMTHYTLTMNGGMLDVAKEAQIYCVPATTRVGTNTFKAGYAVAAALDLFFLHVEEVQLDFSSGSGMAADVALEPIEIYSRSFFSVTGADGSGGPQLSVATFHQTAVQEPDPKLQPPHLTVSGAITLLGEKLGSVYLDGSESGFALDLQSGSFPYGSLALTASITSLDDMSASGSLNVGVDRRWDFGDLGDLVVDVTFKGSLAVAYQSGEATATASLGADLPVVGQVSMPTIDLEVDQASLQHLADLLWDEVVDFYKHYMSDPARWLGLVFNGWLQGVTSVGSVLHHQFQQGYDDLAKTMSQAGYDLHDVAQGLKDAGAAANDFAEAMKGIGADGKAVAELMYDVGGFTADEISSALRGLFSRHVDEGLGHEDVAHVDWMTSVTAHTDFGHVDVSAHVDASA